jgi:hypothetical protein
MGNDSAEAHQQLAEQVEHAERWPDFAEAARQRLA